MDLTSWTPVTLGLSGALVHRHPAGTAYAKTATDDTTRAELRAEQERLEWLAGTPVLAPQVLDRVGDTLVTATLPGVPLSAVPDAGVGALIEAVLAVHALPVAGCPFPRGLEATAPEAARRVAGGLVDASDFDADRHGRTAEEALAMLEQDLPRARGLETVSLSVCHGDLCLPNVHVDPGTGRLAGVLDVGRLGVSDRHQDLALAHRSLGDVRLNPAFGPAAAAAFLTAYAEATGLEPDPWRLGFYRLLDEFF